jgi:hypothetical protein
VSTIAKIAAKYDRKRSIVENYATGNTNAE